MNTARLTGIIAAFILLCGCTEEMRTTDESSAFPDKVFPLPKALNEISGLAVASETSVFAHNDEHGIIYEIDTANGEISRAFALGNPTVDDDFEGVAVSGEHIYLLSSKGLIYEAPIGEHGERVIYNTYDTGLRDRCEFEGLAKASETGEFLLLCKRSAKELPQQALNIYRWSAADRTPPEKLQLSIPLEGALTEEQADAFRPSAIERQNDGRLIILSAASAMLVEIEPEGKVSRSLELSKNIHPQAEGVTFSGAGELLIADEGARRGHGKLSIYKNALQD